MWSPSSIISKRSSGIRQQVLSAVVVVVGVVTVASLLFVIVVVVAAVLLGGRRTRSNISSSSGVVPKTLDLRPTTTTSSHLSTAAATRRRLKAKGGEGGDIIIFLDMDGVLAPWPDHEEYSSSSSSSSSSDDDDDDSDDEDDNNPYEEICFNDVAEKPLAVLSHLLHKIPKHRRRIVLSSSWRFRKECEVLALEYMHDYGKNHKSSPFNSIPKFDSKTGPQQTSRQHEIMDWLKDNNVIEDGDAWIVLDDLTDVIENPKYHDVFVNHSVITNGHIGLTHHDAKKVIKLLDKQLKKKQKQKTPPISS